MEISVRNIDSKIYKRFKDKAKKEGYILGGLLNKLMSKFIGKSK